MRSFTRLTSAVFQLTPTRTRCDLFIIANDKKEKIASGLLNPFLAQLKTAQDQINKGGYSIVLEPESGNDTSWFTKATVERFVRFVSTPEILERVYTIETEIIQIDEAIAMQSINDIGQSTVENRLRKSMGTYEGDKSVTNAQEEKAIVLYTPAAAPSEANGSCSDEGNSKVQLLKVLETRRTALQREQGMAFARAVAAGFDIDDIAPLVSFSECFGAMRLMEACSRFIDLWRRKHETGQWLDIDTAESMTTQPDFSALNASGIIFTTPLNNHGDSNHVLASDNNGNPCSTNNADNPVPNGQQQPIPGQFPQFLFPPWPVHGPPNSQPVFQAYPMQGMPYYQPYAGNGLFFQPQQHPMVHSPSNFDPPFGQEMQSPDVKDSIESETGEINVASIDDRPCKADAAYSLKSRKKAGGSNEKQQGMVVIRNINYITSKEKTFDGDASSDSDSGNDTANEKLEDDGQDVIRQNEKRSSKSRQSHLKAVNKSNFSNDKVNVYEKEVDSRQWQAFQDCLLRGSDGGTHADKKSMFAMEKNGKIKRQAESDDPLVGGGRDTDGIQDNRMGEINIIDGSTDRKLKTHDDFIIGSQQNWATLRNSSDPLAVNNFEGATVKFNRDSSGRMVDESLIATFRSMSLDQGADRNTVDIESEIPSKYQKLESGGSKNKVNYEPNDLTLMPKRRNDKRVTGYDRALDYELQVCAEGSRQKGKNAITNVKGGGIRKPERDRRSKLVSDSLQKPKTGSLVRKGSTSKMGTIEDARARAERLRSYKAELQKMKKEKEEAEAKRLESLKLARQKRIAARGGSTSAKPSTPSPQAKQPLPKISPTTNRSKFTDSGPGSSSPLQRSKVRTSLVRSSEPNKATKASKLDEANSTAGKRLTRSSSSLYDTKREKNVSSDSKASISRITRLSEPKTITNPPATSMKARSAGGALKRKLFEGPEKNKVSAIIDLDRRKAATLPGLKIKTPKPRVNSAHQIDADDNPIVEKSVVLEHEKPSIPPSDTSKAKPVYSNHDNGERINFTAEAAPPHVASSVTKEPVTSQIQKQSDYNKVRSGTTDRDPPNFANTSTDGKSYQAPYARVSSLEVPCTHQSEYGKATAVRPVLTRAEENARILVPGVKEINMDKHQVTSEKSSVKDSPKGLRRLLMFGKKSHTSSSMDQSIGSECTSGDGIEHGISLNKTASTSEARTLKNLISHEETSPAGNAPQKSSHHFSLLSPFWSKKNEKKQAS